LDSVLTQLAAGGPVVVVLDDAQWGDSATNAWLRHATRRLGGVALLLLVARRPEEGAAPGVGTVLSLPPLDRAAVVTLVGAARADELLTRSGGHPMFLLELAH